MWVCDRSQLAAEKRCTTLSTSIRLSPCWRHGLGVRSLYESREKYLCAVSPIHPARRHVPKMYARLLHGSKMLESWSLEAVKHGLRNFQLPGLGSIDVMQYSHAAVTSKPPITSAQGSRRGARQPLLRVSCFLRWQSFASVCLYILLVRVQNSARVPWGTAGLQGPSAPCTQIFRYTQSQRCSEAAR